MPGTPSTDVLTTRQLAFIAERLPEPPQAPTGRPHYSNRDLLPGILRVLRSGCRWRDLNRPGAPSGVTHWRRLRYWHRRKGYRRVWHRLLNFLVQRKRLDRSLISLAGILIPSQEFTQQTGYSGKHRRHSGPVRAPRRAPDPPSCSRSTTARSSCCRVKRVPGSRAPLRRRRLHPWGGLRWLGFGACGQEVQGVGLDRLPNHVGDGAIDGLRKVGHFRPRCHCPQDPSRWPG